MNEVVMGHLAALMILAAVMVGAVLALAESIPPEDMGSVSGRSKQ